MGKSKWPEPHQRPWPGTGRYPFSHISRFRQSSHQHDQCRQDGDIDQHGHGPVESEQHQYQRQLRNFLQNVWDHCGRWRQVYRESYLHPTLLGKLTGTLSFSDNAPNSPQTVVLSGTGVLPATLIPATATYAAQVIGTTSLPKTFTLTNNQTVMLSSIGISTTGDFAVSATTCTTSLAAKGKCTISVVFKPTATGNRTGKLSVSDSAKNSPQTVVLSGTGV